MNELNYNEAAVDKMQSTKIDIASIPELLQKVIYMQSITIIVLIFGNLK